MRILTLKNWQEWAELAKPFDIAYTPEYLDLFKDTAFGGEPRLAMSSGLIYPFYIRSIPDSIYKDIVSPYGYNGPAGNGNYTQFLIEFHEWCLINNIVSEFARLHPFLKNHENLPAIKKNEIVYIDLRQSEDEIWHGFDKGCRSAIKKAQRDIPVFSQPKLVSSFESLYKHTMDNVKAANIYYFTPYFWQSLRALPVLSVYESGAIGTFWLHGNFTMYFLSAHVENEPLNLILWLAIKKAKSQGCKYFNLGGGIHFNDSLFHFKKSFSKTTLPFYVYQKIHIHEVYQELSQGKQTDYFPAYRT